MLFLLGSAALSLIQIEPGDPRLSHSRTFISPSAVAALGQSRGVRVLCHDRERDVSVCLTDQEWREAIAMSHRKTRGPPLALIRVDYVQPPVPVPQERSPQRFVRADLERQAWFH